MKFAIILKLLSPLTCLTFIISFKNGRKIMKEKRWLICGWFWCATGFWKKSGERFSHSTLSIFFRIYHTRKKLHCNTDLQKDPTPNIDNGAWSLLKRLIVIIDGQVIIGLSALSHSSISCIFGWKLLPRIHWCVEKLSPKRLKISWWTAWSQMDMTVATQLVLRICESFVCARSSS